MLTGRPPFECDGAGEFIVAHLREEPPPPSKFVPELPEAVDGLLASCLAKAPDDRFQTMTELQVGIEHVLASLSAPGTEPVPVPAALALAPGFKSVYDGNFGTSLPTQDAPSGSDSRARRPSTLGLLTGELLKPKHAGLRTMFAIVLGAVIAAMIATSLSRRDEASASSAVDVIESVKAAAPQPDAPAVTPPPPPPPAVAPVVEPNRRRSSRRRRSSP